MKILLVEPMKHPREIDIPNTLKEMYRVLNCDTITAVYPWSDCIGLVTDDEGMLKDNIPNRYIEELKQPIFGNFFLCGLDEENFADLPPELMEKYKKKFWSPELIFYAGNKLTVFKMDD